MGGVDGGSGGNGGDSVALLGDCTVGNNNKGISSSSSLSIGVVHHRHTPILIRVASHLFTGGLAGIGKLPALVGWYIRYGITPT